MGRFEDLRRFIEERYVEAADAGADAPVTAATAAEAEVAEATAVTTAARRSVKFESRSARRVAEPAFEPRLMRGAASESAPAATQAYGEVLFAAAPTNNAAEDFAEDEVDGFASPEAFREADASYEDAPAPASLAASTSPAAPLAPCAPAQGVPRANLATLLDHLDAPFSTTLLAIIDARGMTDAEVYKRACLTRQHFNKIRSDAAYRPTKRTVLALALALRLTEPETADLLRRAGFAFSPSSKADLIVQYFILRGEYDLFAVNEALYEFDQPLLA